MNNPASSPANKALWFIETHFASEIRLDDIAAIGGVSRFQMSRAFCAVTGYSVTGYVRARRLSEAAKALAQGAVDILTVAIDAGYGSHEAFTRAFREQFGLTPEAVRAQGHLHNLALMEPIKMDQTHTQLDAPRFEEGRLLLLAGIGERYDCNSSAAIPAQWQRFTPYLEAGVPGQVGKIAYGAKSNFDDDENFDYLCGVEVRNFSNLPADWTRLRIPPQRYAVFTHRDHVSMIRRTWSTIWDTWLPASGMDVIDAPHFERYDEKFDGRTGMGGIEIWLPVRG